MNFTFKGTVMAANPDKRFWKKFGERELDVELSPSVFFLISNVRTYS